MTTIQLIHSTAATSTNDTRVPARDTHSGSVLRIAGSEGRPRCDTCQHDRPCPSADAPDREAARVVASHPEQGWSLLCNGVVLFDDTGELLPDGRVIAPHRPLAA
jgi:Family of unknown function (DUF5999)